MTTTAPTLQAVRLIGRAMPSTDGRPLGTVEAVALDQDGNPFRSPLTQTVLLALTVKSSAAAAGTGPGAAVFVSNGSSKADIGLSDVNPETGDVRTQIMVRYPEGIGTLTVDGQPTAGTVAGLLVYPGAIIGDQVGLPARVAIEPIVDTPAGQSRPIYVNVLDANGYRVTQAGPLAGIVVTLQDQTEQPWHLTQVEPGHYRFDVTQLRAGTYTYTARLQPKGATATAAGKVTAANSGFVKLLTTDLVIPADSHTEAVLKVELADTNGNRLTTPHLVTFEPGLPEGVTQPQPLTSYTVTAVNGLAQLRLTAGRVVGEQEFRVIVANPMAPSVPLVSGFVMVSSRGLAQRLALRYGDNNRNGSADDGDNVGRASTPFLVDVAVLDERGGDLPYEGSRPVKLTALNVDTGMVAFTRNASAVAGRATFALDLSQAGNYALKAESDGLASIVTRGYGGVQDNVIIQPGPAIGVKIAVDTAYLEAAVSPDNYALVTAHVTDAKGNPVINDSGRSITVNVTLPNSTAGYFTVDDLPETPEAPSRRVTIPAGVNTSQPVKLFGRRVGVVQIQIESADGVKSGATTVTVMKLGKTAKLDEVQFAQPPGGLPPGSRMVQLTALDASGRRLTGTTGMRMKAVGGDATIIGYYNVAGTLTRVDPAPEVDIPTDRGRVAVVLGGRSGSLAAFEAYETQTPAVRKLIYVQF